MFKNNVLNYIVVLVLFVCFLGVFFLFSVYLFLLLFCCLFFIVCCWFFWFLFLFIWGGGGVEGFFCGLGVTFVCDLFQLLFYCCFVICSFVEFIGLCAGGGNCF